MTRFAFFAPGKRAGAVAAALFLLGFLVYVLVFFPGFMSNDSAHQLLEARRNDIGDWHSPFMTALWGGLDRLIPGPAGLLLLQSAILWAGIWGVWRAGLSASAPYAGALLLSLLMFYPPVSGIAGVIWKDILMWAFLVCAIAAARALDANAPAGPRFRLYLGLLAAFSLLALLMRMNAVFFITVLFAYIAARIALRAPRPSLLRIAIFIAAAILAAGLLLAVSMKTNALIAKRADTHPVLSVVLFDISGVIAKTPAPEAREALFDELPGTFKGDSTGARLARTYASIDWQRPFNADPPGLYGPVRFATDRVPGFSTLSDSERSALRALWAEAILERPGAYLQHRANAFWYVIGGPPAQWSPVFMDPAGYSEPLQKILPPFAEQTPLQKTLQGIYQKLSFFAPYKPWFYMLLAGALVIFNLARGDLFVFDNALATASLAHMGGLFFLAPSPDYRYSHIAVFTTVLALVLAANRLGLLHKAEVGVRRLIASAKRSAASSA